MTPSPHATAHLRAATVVTVTTAGAALHRLIPARAWAIDPPTRLTLTLPELEELARISVHGLEADAPGDLADTLREFGLLTADRPATPVPVPGPSAAAPGPTALAGQRPDDTLVLATPAVFALRTGRYVLHDHDGRVLADLDAGELWAVRTFASPVTAAAAAAGGCPADLIDRLRTSGALHPAGPDDRPSGPSDDDELAAALRAEAALRVVTRTAQAEHDHRLAEAGTGRARCFAVQVAGNVPPLSTGMVLAHAAAHLGPAAEAYDLYPRWILHADDIPEAGRPGDVYLFTNYLWSHERNLDFAAAVKARHPGSVTVFGGPDLPAKPGDTETYLERNPQVDIAVRGEGEVTFTEMLRALAPSIRAGRADLHALRTVPGVVYRSGAELVRTADRARLDDVNEVPSPYLTGVFDDFGRTRQIGMAIVETNRGCPYGCTFCDWGSATNSRIRKFDLDRVFAELEWCAANAVPKIFMADANFGIFARDVDIARHVVDLRARYGYPLRFISNYAKNTVKHLSEIVTLLTTGGVLSEGLLSLQSMDDDTLRAIRRSNIKLDHYERLATEFHQARMPLFVDLMMGLPGQTVDSLRADLQQCVDREVSAKCHATELLVNSPMNEPDYRAEHRIEVTRPPGPTGAGAEEARRRGPAFVVSSSSFTRDDYDEMNQVRRAYLLAENFGTLRQITRFARSEVGIHEVELVERLRTLVTRDPDRWPTLALTLLGTPDAMVPPVSWAFLTRELGELLVDQVGLTPGSALDTVLAVQHAVLPTPGRVLPLRLLLPHDYARWSDAILELKDSGRRHDWETVGPRLADFGPAEFVVSDPHGVCRDALGRGSAIAAYLDWELESPVARAMPAHFRVTQTTAAGPSVGAGATA